MKLTEKEKKELEKFVEENKNSINQNFSAYRKATNEKEQPVKQHKK